MAELPRQTYDPLVRFYANANQHGPGFDLGMRSPRVGAIVLNLVVLASTLVQEALPRQAFLYDIEIAALEGISDLDRSADRKANPVSEKQIRKTGAKFQEREATFRVLGFAGRRTCRACATCNGPSSSRAEGGFAEGPKSQERNMAEPTEREIMERAYKLWERAGRPENREDEFWHAAQQELRNEDKSSNLRTPDTL